MKDAKELETPEELGRTLRQFTDNPETWAEFYEAIGRPLSTMQERLKAVYEARNKGNLSEAIRYAKTHNVLPYGQLRELVREYIESIMEKQVGEALDLAREYHFPELAKKAAVLQSEKILTHSGWDVDPLLEVARKERGDDKEYCRRAARYAFSEHIKFRRFSDLPRLVVEFRPHFSEEEVALAKFLAQMTTKVKESEQQKLRATS